MSGKEEQKDWKIDQVRLLVAGQVDAGKCFGPETNILSYDGTIKNVKTIKIGDMLLGDDNQPRIVKKLYTGKEVLYNIIPDIGIPFRVTGNHILCLKYDGSVSSNLYSDKILEITVNDYLQSNNSSEFKNYKLYKTSVEFTYKKVKYPFLLGLWLKQAYTTNISLPEFTELYGINYKKFNSFLDSYGLLDHLFIPNDYKCNSKKVRLQVLSGLLNANNDNELIIKSSELSDDIIYLARSLGFNCNYSNDRIYISGNIQEITENQDVITDTYKVFNWQLSDFKIQKSEIDDYYGFKVDGNNRILLEDFTVSHNSSIIGVLVHDKLDTPDCPIAKEVDKFAHELESGKTSSVSTHQMIRNKKVVDLVNLCGHKKYLKNTLYGMSGTYSDYGMLLVNVNKGLTEMGIEHLNIFVHLNIPFFIVVTKIDLCQDKKMYTTVHKQLHKEVQKNKKTAISLRVNDEYSLTENYNPYLDFMHQRSDIVPIISISNRTGKNMDILKDFLFKLQSRSLWNDDSIHNNVFFITSVYSVQHVGLVVAGVVKSKVPIKTTDEWYVGPYSKKDAIMLTKRSRRNLINNVDDNDDKDSKENTEPEFYKVRIKSIHNDIRQDVDELSNSESGCLCIRFVDKDQVLNRGQFFKGMILTNDIDKIKKNVVREFTASIMILQHHTSIKNNFQSVIHMGPIRQAAKVLCKSEEYLRTGDISIVKFRWLFRAEYTEPGTKFFGREGSCRFCGEVLSVE